MEDTQDTTDQAMALAEAAATADASAAIPATTETPNAAPAPEGAAEQEQSSGAANAPADDTAGAAANTAEQPAAPDAPVGDALVETEEPTVDAYADHGPAPEAPYHLIDTEHHTINLIAAELGKAPEEAWNAIKDISTELRHPDVAKYKADLLAWLEGQ